MKEKDFYEVVSAIAQFIEKADNENSGPQKQPVEQKISGAIKIVQKAKKKRG